MIFKDQTGESIQLNRIPRKIVSLVPSQSELLWDLGLHEQLVGITKFCIHPEEMYRSVTRVGGTKTLDIEKIKALQPDLVIGNKEENTKEQIDELRKYFPLWLSDIVTIPQALEMISEIGSMTGKNMEAGELLQEIRNNIQAITGMFKGESVAYFIWKDPYMLAADETFIHALLCQLGLRNAAGHLSRYPEVTPDDLQKINPEYCFLSSEPFPFKDQHVKELKAVLPDSNIMIVDGELFSWYGSRLKLLQAGIKKLMFEMSI